MRHGVSLRFSRYQKCFEQIFVMMLDEAIGDRRCVGSATTLLATATHGAGYSGVAFE
jgi:hypothetical protein